MRQALRKAKPQDLLLVVSQTCETFVRARVAKVPVLNSQVHTFRGILAPVTDAFDEAIQMLGILAFRSNRDDVASFARVALKETAQVVPDANGCISASVLCGTASDRLLGYKECQPGLLNALIPEV